MSPREIWCNEAQERYVLAIPPDRIGEFRAICERERCPFAVLGTAVDEDRLVVHDNEFDNNAVDMPLSVLLGKPPKMTRDVKREQVALPKFDTRGITIKDAAERVLRLPSVADKTFLIPEQYVTNWDAMTNLYKEYIADIVTGKKPVSAFDEYVQKWYKAGGTELSKYAATKLK